MHYRLKHHKLQARRAFRRFEKRYRNHKHALPVTVVLVLIFIGVSVGLALRDSDVTLKKRSVDTSIVILHADSETRVLPTREKTVAGLLENAKISLHEGDIVEPSLDTEIDQDDFRINVYRAAPVVIQDEDKRIVAVSAAQTSRSIADQVGLEIYPEDYITTEPSRDFLRDGVGNKVTIERSTPVNLNLYGTPLQIRTHANTVGDLLEEKSIELDPEDKITPSLDTPVSRNTQIFITRIGTEVVTSEEEIPMPVETVEDMSLSFGATAIRQVGAPGKKSVTYQLNIQNGVEVGRTLIQEVVVQEPVKQIVARGKAFNIASDKTAVMNAAGISPSDHVYVNYIVNRESRWDITARNSSSGAYGLCQALPGSKMASAGADWETNPVTQLRWCHGYALSRYGSWEAAYNTWLSQHWW